MGSFIEEDSTNLPKFGVEFQVKHQTPVQGGTDKRKEIHENRCARDTPKYGMWVDSKRGIGLQVEQMSCCS